MKGNFPQPNIFSDMDGLVFGFSSTADGDMRDRTNRDTFLLSRTDQNSSLIVMGQIHGNTVQDVSEIHETTEIEDVDGIIRKAKKGESPVFLGVRVADCVPIFAVDPKQRIYAVAHAGWKGTLKKIIVPLLTEMMERGSRKSDIRVFVGPHICSSCYQVEKTRAQRFEKIYGKSVVSFMNERYFLDLTQAIKIDARSFGLYEDQMEMSHICTSCGRWPSFSYRKSNGNLNGEMMGIVGFI